MDIAEKLIRAKTDLDEVYEAGKQAEYDRFWDSYQDYGNRTNCRAMFAGTGWNAESFRPKYKTTPSSNTAVFMFYFFNCITSSNKIDYREYKHLFDFSGVTNGNSMFKDARMDFIDIDLPNATNLTNAFAEDYYAGVKTHITLTISEKCTAGLNSAFNYCTALTDLIFTEGSVIAASFNVSDCPLVAESLVSTVEALSGTVSGKTLTVNQSAIDNADWSTTNYASWEELKATKPNWGFAYK